MTNTLLQRLEDVCANGPECKCTAQDAIREIVRLDADAAGVQAELASVKQYHQAQWDLKNQQVDQLESDLRRANAALQKLTNGFKYSTEVCTIAREALGTSHEPNSVPTEKRFEPLGGDVRDDVVIGWACQKCERLNYIGLPPERCEGCGAPRGEKKNRTSKHE